MLGGKQEVGEGLAPRRPPRPLFRTLRVISILRPLFRTLRVISILGGSLPNLMGVGRTWQLSSMTKSVLTRDATSLALLKAI